MCPPSSGRVGYPVASASCRATTTAFTRSSPTTATRVAEAMARRLRRLPALLGAPSADRGSAARNWLRGLGEQIMSPPSPAVCAGGLDECSDQTARVACEDAVDGART